MANIIPHGRQAASFYGAEKNAELQKVDEILKEAIGFFTKNRKK
jgi:hypothetical protein